jgi:hypothetical protein
MIAYLNIMHKIDPGWLRNAFELTPMGKSSECFE